MTLPHDYAERVYAGVLGKLIGVYLGRPFEGWTYERITAELGDINGYVHERFGVPLVVTDDDISGTFTFLRALPDYGFDHNLSAAQIGSTWLNYIIEGKTILWWGGVGNSTEHTAYIRLTQGVKAPHSGSAALNGQLVAEQIGAQIFVDGWAMVAPGDPELAASFAQKAASVSHDGAAVHAAMLLAAMEAQAFVEADIHKLLEVGLSVIPESSVIHRLVNDLREWHAKDHDWRVTRARIALYYGYDKYGGNCHVVPNHAVILLSLLYCDDSFDRALMIANTCGWDTDCNSGSVGCLMGIKNGVKGLEARQDWRGPIGDRLYLSSADGGRAITDAVTETYHVVNIGRTLANKKVLTPKNGARFHFELPGSVQGFRVLDQAHGSVTTIENVLGHSEAGNRSLAVHFQEASPNQPARLATATFITPEAIAMPGYGLVASPALYPGQVLRGRLEAAVENTALVECRPYVAVYKGDDSVDRRYGEVLTVAPGDAQTFAWRLADTESSPIFEAGLEMFDAEARQGTIYLDYLHWDGQPQVVLRRPPGQGQMWLRAWASSMDNVSPGPQEAKTFYATKARGTGLLIQGTRDWLDYRVTAVLTSQAARSFGVAVRVQGLRRYYALVLGKRNTVRLIKVRDEVTVFQERPWAWEFGTAYNLSLQVAGSTLRASLDGTHLFEVVDENLPLASGGIALVCEEGFMSCCEVKVTPTP